MLTRWNRNLGLGRFHDFADMDRGDPVMSDLRREMNRLFSDFDRGGAPARFAFDRTARSWPLMELADQGDALLLRVEVPGFAEGDLDVSLDKSTLTLRGERETSVPEGYSVHRQERGSLRFARTVVLPCLIQGDETTATLKDGVLELRLPKAAEERPRQIQVKTS